MKLFKFLHLQNIYNFINKFIIRILNNKSIGITTQNLKVIFIS